MKQKEQRRLALLTSRPGEAVNNQIDKINQDPEIITINSLHESILSNAKNMVKSAIVIGEILVKRKEQLNHGQFLPWIENNLSFSRFTASRYMNLFENRDKLNVASVQHLKEAYKILSLPEKEEKEINPNKVNLSTIYKEWQKGKKLDKGKKTLLKSYIESKIESLEKQSRKFKDQLKNLDKP